MSSQFQHNDPLTWVTKAKICKLVQLEIERCTVAAVETPDFDDDDDDSDAVILDQISCFLIAQHLRGIKLKSLILLHGINTERCSGSHKQYLEPFCKLCGDEARMTNTTVQCEKHRCSV